MWVRPWWTTEHAQSLPILLFMIHGKNGINKEQRILYKEYISYKEWDKCYSSVRNNNIIYFIMFI